MLRNADLWLWYCRWIGMDRWVECSSASCCCFILGCSLQWLHAHFPNTRNPVQWKIFYSYRSPQLCYIPGNFADSIFSFVNAQAWWLVIMTWNYDFHSGSFMCRLLIERKSTSHFLGHNDAVSSSQTLITSGKSIILDCWLLFSGWLYLGQQPNEAKLSSRIWKQLSSTGSPQGGIDSCQPRHWL